MSDASLRADEVASLYEKYGFFLLRRCKTILRDETLAQDVLHEAFVKIMRSGAAVRDADAPLKWLYRVVDNVAFDAIRSRKRSREDSPPQNDNGETREIGETAHPSIDIETRDAVMSLLHELSDDEKKIALFLFVDGMSQGEIAEEVGVSRVTLNKRVQAIRARADAWLGKAPS